MAAERIRTSAAGRQEFSDVTKAIAQRGLQNAPPGVAGNSAAADSYSGHFAVVLDTQIKSRPIVNFVDNPSGIDGRTGAEINGLSFGEANDLAQILQIGALPVDLNQISSSTVSATLGTVLKYREDQERVRQHGVGDLVKQAFERGLLPG